jgi:hypothetical protein
MAGRKMQQVAADKNATALTLDVSTLPAGLWLIQLRGADGTVVRPLVIER